MQFIRLHLFRALFGFCFTIITQSAWCQSFGGLPPGIKWKQINTDTVRIIFPTMLESQAQRLANAIHYLRQHAQDDIGDKTYKIDIVVNNQSTIANGSVSIAPWKSHFLTTPLQDNFALSSMPWLDLLAIHEYRHVTQLSTARRGIVKLLSILFGQESWAGGANLSIPNWFTEGDAVWAETHFSNQGRGRLSHFLQGYRAFDLEGQHISYAKARNGSIRDYVPDHYRLGYLMLQHGRQYYGDNFWKEVLIESAAYKGILYPFSNAIRRKTGLNTRGLYMNMLDGLERGSYPSQEESPNAVQILPHTPPTTFSDHLHPYFYHRDSSLIYFKRTYEKIGAFYVFNFASGKEKHLITRGIGIEPYFGHAGGLIAWTELTTDPRWSEKDYTDIITYDIAQGIRRRITRKKRYFSPQPNSTASQIICTNVAENGQSVLHILDGQTGAISNTFEHPGWFYTFPKWSHDDRAIIVSVRDQNGHMGIVKIDVTTGDEREVVPMRNKILGVPAVDSTAVFYSASTEGLENIFATDLETGITRQVTNEPNGAFQAALGPNGLYYTTFTSQGHVIKQVYEGQMTSESNGHFEFPVKLNVLDSFPENNYTVTDYKNWAHSLNIHTWGLNIEDPEISARVLSNNVLNNIELSAGVTYNYDREIYRPFAEVQVATFYPTLALQASTIKRSAIIEDSPRNWREVNVFAGAFVDYNLTSRSFQRKLTPLIGYNRTRLTGDIDTSISSLLAQITFVQQQVKARKNIFTHNGQFLQLRYSRATDQFRASQMQIRSGLALRGIGINHNLLLEADLKADLEEAEYQFSNGLSHRGFGIIQAEKMLRMGADYHFPLFYPDWGLAGLVYLYRIRADLFFEHTRILRSADSTSYYSSVGGELVFDVNLVNTLEASLGFRYSYPLDKFTSPSYEVFIPVYRF